MEDVFAVDWTGYSTPPDSGWQDPSGDVPALTDQVALAAPYEAVKDYGSLAADVQLSITLAAAGVTGVSLGYRAYVSDGAGGWAPPVDVPFFTPSGVLSTAIDELTSEIVVASGLDTDLVESVSAPDFSLGVNVAWIVHDGVEEFIAFQNVVQGESDIKLQVIARGCLDSAPTAFPAGTRVWFISYGSQIVNLRGPVPPTINVYNDIRIQAYNNQSEFPFTSCPTTQVVATTPARSAKVYCPTDVRFNGESYPASITGELTVSWSHRNRLGTWSYVDSGKTSSPEPGTEYDVLVYGELDTLVHTESGLTGTSWTYHEADEISESGFERLNNHVSVVVQTYREGRSTTAQREITWRISRL
jgi:hypothetical protein